MSTASPTHGPVVIGIQQPGSQLIWDPSSAFPGMGGNDPLPLLPTSGLWTGQQAGSMSAVRSVPAQQGPNTWRVLGETLTLTDDTGQKTTVILVVATDIG